MKKSIRIAALLLVLSLYLSTVCTAAAGLQYMFSDTKASAANDLFEYEGSKVTVAPSGMDQTKGTHYYAGNGNFSRFSSAHVCRTGASGEEPVCYDEGGTPFYVQAAHTEMEKRGLFVDDYYMNGRHVEEKCYARWDYIQQFVLADTKTGAVTTTYCADQVTAVMKGYYYNIENVEDADYYTDAQARKIRAIALNGYWGDDLDAPSGLGSLSVMKDKLRASGKFTEDELARLTDGIAMTATQYAIWEYSNLSRGDKRISAYYTDEAGNILGVSEEQKASVDLIFKVYHYLIGLEPESVGNTTADTVITKENFLTTLGVSANSKIADHANNLDEDPDNDAYIADLSFTMAVLPKAGNGDDLVAVVYGADGAEIARGRIAGEPQSGEVTLKTDGNGKYTFEDLEMVEGTQNLSITLEGTQHLERGVYLYTAAQGSDSSQTLVGIAEGAHQVDVALEWDVKFSVQEEGPERIINIYKTGSNIPLEGIAFDFYYVASRSDYLSGKVDMPAAKDHPIPDVADYTIITDEEGAGSFNLTENSMPDGVYLVVEREHPLIAAPVDPFYVILPATSPDGTQLVYEVDIYPKNTVDDNVIIEKDVITVGNNSSDVSATEPHTWIIGTSIPADIGNSKYFIISDTLDSRLDYVGNIRVQVENRSGTVIAVTLMEGQDYTVTVTDVDSLSDGKPSDSFTVRLTSAGMSRVESAVAGGIDRIRVYFDAQINSNASVGEEIPNQATLDYKNSVGVSFRVESDIPEVYTGGICLEKVDADDPSKKLEGAVFRVYRAATEAEAGDETIEKITLGELSVPMVPVSFYNAHLTGEQVTEVVSDANGSFGVYGLAYGTYYLLETQAPAGYNLSAVPIKVTIHETSHQPEYTIPVTNHAGTILPETGGMGTTIFYIVGGVMVVAAVVLLVTKKRMGKEDETT